MSETQASGNIGIDQKLNPEPLMEKKFNLKELIKKDWEKDSVVGSVGEYLRDFSITNLGEVVDTQNPSPEFAQLKDETISLMQKRGVEGLEVHVINDRNSESNLFVSYQLGEDQVVVIGKPAVYENSKERQHPDSLIIDAEKMGIIDKNGVVMSIDQLAKAGSSDDEKNSVWLELNPDRQSNCLKRQDRKSMKPLSLMPTNSGEAGSLFHEMGHMYIYRNIYRDSKLTKIMDTNENQFPYLPASEREFSAYQIYSMKMRDERSAWAVGLSILRSLQKSNTVHLALTETEGIIPIKERMENRLDSYNRFYSTKILEQPNDKSIPLASDRARKAARGLHQFLLEHSMTYDDIPESSQSDFPSFVDSPVFHTDRPERILEKLIADLSS